jgi:membrane protein
MSGEGEARAGRAAVHVPGRSALKWTLRVLGLAIARFRADGCTQLAAAISYFTLLSFVPAIVLVISALALLLRPEGDLVESVFGNLRQYFPFIPPAFAEQVVTLFRHAGTMGWVALGALLLTTEMVFGAVHQALNRVFGAQRGFLRSKLVSLILIVSVVAVLGFVLVMTALSSGLDHLAARWVPDSAWAGIGRNFLVAYALPFGLVALVLSAALKFIPNRRVHVRAALTGGLLCALLWEGAKRLFAWYVGSIAQYNVIYGSLGTLIVGLIYVHLSTSLFLFSAELAAIVNGELEEREGGVREE